MVAFGHDMRDVELVEDDDAPGAARPVGSGTPTTGRPAGAGPRPVPHEGPGGDPHEVPDGVPHEGRHVAPERPARPPGGPAHRTVHRHAHRSTHGPAYGPTHGPAHGPSRRWAVGLVVALLAVGSGEVASAARARSSMTALARVPGILAPLPGPVGEVWRADRTLRSELVPAGGLLVGIHGTVGSADVVALDPATGATVWRTPVRPAGPGDGGGGLRCVVPEPPADAGPPRAAPATGPGPAPVVVCVADRTHRGREGDAPASTDRVVVLDATTGSVLSQRPVERSTTLAGLDGDVVVAHVDDRGHLHVTRTDPLGADERWTFVSPRPLPVPRPGWRTRLTVDDGVVLLDEADGWALSADGEVLRSWSAGPVAELAGTARLHAGRLLLRPGSNGGPYPRTEATDLVTGRHLAVQGRPLAAWPDDGSLDGSLLIRSGGREGLLAYDAATGALRWAVDGHVEGRALVVDGRVLRITSGALTSVDGRTGATVWSTPLVRPARTSMVTDGRLVVVTELDGDRGVVLGAYGLDDGRLRWRSDVGDDIAVITVLGRQLFGWTGEQLVALTAPR